VTGSNASQFYSDPIHSMPSVLLKVCAVSDGDMSEECTANRCYMLLCDQLHADHQMRCCRLQDKNTVIILMSSSIIITKIGLVCS